jgi:hypothetical protein
MLALADYANKEGLCWPSFATLASKARLSKRHVIRLVNELESEKEIEVQRRKGRGGANLYRVTPGGDDLSPDEKSSVVTSAPQTVTSDTKKVTSTSPEPSVDPLSRTMARRGDKFDEYPTSPPERGDQIGPDEEVQRQLQALYRKLDVQHPTPLRPRS